MNGFVSLEANFSADNFLLVIIFLCSCTPFWTDLIKIHYIMHKLFYINIFEAHFTHFKCLYVLIFH